MIWALRLARNIAPTRELEAFGPSLRVTTRFPSFFRVVLSTSGDFMHVKRVPPIRVPAATCFFVVQVLKGVISFSLADVAEGSNDFPRGVSSLSSVFFVFCGTHFVFGLLQLQAYLFSEMAKKKSCQNVHNPRVLSPVERELYGWVDAEVFTQSSVLAS
ncbi:hypothetical protein PIB30_052948 [Stylosanthes scabra]|uniref:Uncharacterized protein n=1 Tax=Stylosanthes scabra TaxID=79078 RepID=A0ABU6ZH59_9FABA|nr:hypothetical protein [Stylosanthes scabra]